MGLSEREQQLLDEMERRLYQSEADVMQAPAGPRPQMNLRFLVWGVVVGLVGIGAMIAGVAAQQLWLGILGFVLMLGGVLLATSQGKAAAGGEDPLIGAARSGSAKAARPAAARESFSDRMNRRWDQRMDGDQ